MKDAGMQPNVFTYSHAILAAERCGEYEEAVALFNLLANDGLDPNQDIMGAMERCRMHLTA